MEDEMDTGFIPFLGSDQLMSSLYVDPLSNLWSGEKEKKAETAPQGSGLSLWGSRQGISHIFWKFRIIYGTPKP